MKRLPSTLILLAALAACGTPRPPTPTAGSAAPAATATAGGPAPSPAIAHLRNAEGQAAGQAELRDTGSGVEIRISAQGLKPGPHGFHIHARGACAPGPDAATGKIVPFGAAGGHFDPGVTHNHGQPGDPPEHVHAGELPNLTAGADGRGTLRTVNTHVTLAPGKRSVLGRTLVVHADPDDYATDPAGNSGPRVLCGLIEPAQPGAVVHRAFVDHPNAYPEGIAVDPRTGTAYVGSTTEGHIWKIAPGAGQAELFQIGGAHGRQAAYGMTFDGQGRLWVAGGPQNSVSVLDAASGTTLATLKGPQGTHAFLNDLVRAGGHVYVTDSFRPLLLRADAAAGPGAALEPWLDLSTTPIRYRPNEINLNGIVASADGRLLLAIQLVTGQLWRIDTATRAVAEVRVEGGDLRHGDGLLLRGTDELYVVRNQDNEVVRLQLAPGWQQARVVQRLTDPRLKYPTTAAAAASGLLVVNAQLDKLQDPPPLLPFDVVTLAWPR